MNVFKTSSTPRGVVRVRIIEGRDLPNKDFFSKSDPYCLVKSSVAKQKTKTIKDNLNPVWNETFELQIANPATEVLTFEVWDWDALDRDDMLGFVSYPLQNLVQGQDTDTWLALQTSRRKARGQIHIVLTALNFGKPPMMMPQQMGMYTGQQAGYYPPMMMMMPQQQMPMVGGYMPQQLPGMMMPMSMPQQQQYPQPVAPMTMATPQHQAAPMPMMPAQQTTSMMMGGGAAGYGQPPQPTQPMMGNIYPAVPQQQLQLQLQQQQFPQQGFAKPPQMMQQPQQQQPQASALYYQQQGYRQM